MQTILIDFLKLSWILSPGENHRHLLRDTQTWVLSLWITQATFGPFCPLSSHTGGCILLAPLLSPPLRHRSFQPLPLKRPPKRLMALQVFLVFALLNLMRGGNQGCNSNRNYGVNGLGRSCHDGLMVRPGQGTEVGTAGNTGEAEPGTVPRRS